METADGFAFYWERLRRGCTSTGMPKSIAERCFPASDIPECWSNTAWHSDRTEHMSLVTYLKVSKRCQDNTPHHHHHRCFIHAA